MMTRQIWLLSQGVTGSLLGLFLMTSVLAQQQFLTRAEVYKLVNQVQLLLKNQPPRLAKLSDVLISQNALRTTPHSTAELLFQTQLFNLI